MPPTVLASAERRRRVRRRDARGVGRVPRRCSPRASPPRTRATCCRTPRRRKIVVTMNVRELLHFLTLRCCKRAQWEIRELALKMLDLAEPTAPYIFMDAGAACRRGRVPRGRHDVRRPVPEGAEALSRGRIDQGVIDAFIIVPPRGRGRVAAPALGQVRRARRGDPVGAVRLRAAARRSGCGRRSARRSSRAARRCIASASATRSNTSFVATALVGLAALDVVRAARRPVLDRPAARVIRARARGGIPRVARVPGGHPGRGRATATRRLLRPRRKDARCPRSSTRTSAARPCSRAS